MGLRCLIVDDNALFLAAAGNLLEREGMVVGVASNCAEAIARFEEFCPDVTLVDVELGEECGVDLARELAVAAKHSSRLILCSAHSELDFADLTVDSQPVAFLPKCELSATAIHEILQRPPN